MSKEMTSEEALQIIQDNITPRTLAILTVEFNIVEKALDRLEVLENENKKWHEIVGCDLCDALGREILLEENKKLKKAIDDLKLENSNLKHSIDEKNEIIGDLEEEVKDTASFYMSKCEKFEKVIEIIKSKNVDIFFLRNNSEFDLEKYNYEIKNNNMQYCYKDCLPLTQEKNDLLKEVLENENNFN